MAEMVFVCRDGLASSYVGNLLVAMEAKKAGVDVSVLFAEEALAPISGGVLNWPPGLAGQEMRYKMADNAKAMGIPTKGGKGDGRQIDARGMIAAAKDAGVPMYACPAWAGLLGLQGKLPEGITEIDIPGMLKMLTETKQVIGGF